jgi:hypothetical protein
MRGKHFQVLVRREPGCLSWLRRQVEDQQPLGRGDMQRGREFGDQ